MRLVHYAVLPCILAVSAPLGAQAPAPGPSARLMTRAQVRTVKMPGIKLDYMDVLWNETAFEAFESGGALALAQRPWFLARLELSRSVRLDDTDVPPGVYALVAHANRDGKGTSLEVREVPPTTALRRGILVEAPPGRAVCQQRVTWERVNGASSPRAEIRLEPVEGGGRIITLYGDRRMVQSFRFPAEP
jgi:hypothetical protein